MCTPASEYVCIIHAGRCGDTRILTKFSYVYHRQGCTQGELRPLTHRKCLASSRAESHPSMYTRLHCGRQDSKPGTQDEDGLDHSLNRIAMLLTTEYSRITRQAIRENGQVEGISLSSIVSVVMTSAYSHQFESIQVHRSTEEKSVCYLSRSKPHVIYPAQMPSIADGKSRWQI